MCGFCLFVAVFSVLFVSFNNKTCISDFKLLPVCFRHCVHEMFSRILPKELEWKHSIMIVPHPVEKNTKHKNILE